MDRIQYRMDDVQCQIIELESPSTFVLAAPAGDASREMAIKNVVELLRFSSSEVDERPRLVEPWRIIFIFLIPV